MSARNSDRNLLFGILALRMDFISRESLVKAMNDWVLDKEKPLGEILVANEALSPRKRDLLEQMVDAHVEDHEAEPGKSLAALSSVGSVREDLAGVEDSDVQDAMTYVSIATHSPHEDATITHAGPSASSDVGEGSSLNTRFRIIRPHAEGGLGKVSVAMDRELNREVALKEIKEAYVHDESARTRFTLEAEITGGLEHPGIVPVYGLGHRDDGQPFYAMRFIKGDSLKEAADRFHSTPSYTKDRYRSLTFRRLLERFVDVCNAVEYAHSRGVLHRDLKPGNVMLGKYGETLVVDWGLAKAVGKDESYAKTDEQTFQPALSGSSLATQMGSALGTPSFMSPEQAAGRLDELGPQSDVYSLGATLYYLLTNRPPFVDANPEIVIAKVQLGEFDRPRQVQPDIPIELESICQHAMSTTIDNRYSSAKTLAADIECFLAGEPVSTYRESTSEKSRRWINRRREVFAVLVVSTLVLTWLGYSHLAAEVQRRTQANESQTSLASVTEQLASAEELMNEVRPRQLDNVRFVHIRSASRVSERENVFSYAFRAHIPRGGQYQLCFAIGPAMALPNSLPLADLAYPSDENHVERIDIPPALAGKEAYFELELYPSEDRFFLECRWQQVPSLTGREFQMHLDSYSSFEAEIIADVVNNLIREETEQSEIGTFSIGPMLASMPIADDSFFELNTKDKRIRPIGCVLRMDSEKAKEDLRHGFAFWIETTK